MCQLRLAIRIIREITRPGNLPVSMGLWSFFWLSFWPSFFIHFSHTYPIVLTQPLVKMNLHKRSAVKLSEEQRLKQRLQPC